MTRVLVVQQFTKPGSPHDQQRGPIYTPCFRASGMEVKFVGRHPIQALRWSRSRSTFARRLTGSLTYKVWTKALDVVVTALNDKRIVRIAKNVDVVLLIKVDSLRLVRELRRTTRARLVYDVADVRRPRSDGEHRSIDEILTIVDSITADNGLGAANARRHNSSVHVWPPTAYVERFDMDRASSRRGRDGRVVLGWVGTPSTVSNLYLILESLEDVFRLHDELHLRLIGVPPEHELLRRFERVRASCLPAYDASDMIREVLDLDIGLFPMFDLEDAAMHGITKALIYMGGGAVAVCSPVGECPKLVRDGENGLLAAGRAEWTAALDHLIREPTLRAKLSEAGLATVRDGYSLKNCFEQLRGAIGA